MLSRPGFTAQGASELMRGAWLAVACEAAALLFRPVQSWLLTAHRNVGERLFKWRPPGDILEFGAEEKKAGVAASDPVAGDF